MDMLSNELIDIEYFLNGISVGVLKITPKPTEKHIYETARKHHIENYDSYTIGGLGDKNYRSSKSLDKYTKLALNRFYSDIGADVTLV